MNKISVLIISIIFLSSCHARDNAEGVGASEHQAATQTAQIAVVQELPATRELNRTMFVSWTGGLRVRNSPSSRADIIGVVSDLSEVFVVKEETRDVIIDQFLSRWTFVEADDIQGWVSGRFLSMEPSLRFRITLAQPPTGVYPAYVEAIDSRRWLVFSDGSREDIIWWDAATWWGDLENTRVFSTNSKESEYELIARGGFFSFFKIDQIDGWLFLANRGFVYIYDLPVSNNPHEYRLMQQFPKFSRHGPLLQVNHNNNIIRFWDTGVEITADRIVLVAYFEDHEELLLRHSGQGFSTLRIYSLRLGAYTDFNGGLPRFNSSRDAVISVDYFDGTAFIGVFTIDNGIYTRVLSESLAMWNIGETRWLNDDEFKIGPSSPESGNQVFLIRRNDAGFEMLRQE
jgi:hypothetical protein